jgi:hypothetical protein
MAKLQHRRPTREASPAPQRAKLAEAAPTGPVSLRHPAPGAIVQRAMAAPHSLRPAELIAMQRTLGNRAVGAMLAPIQAKLIVNAPGDEYEREADRVADAVMGAPAVQREGDEHQLQTQPLTIQRRPGSGGMTVPSDLETAVHDARGGGRPLPDTLRARMEQAFGADFNGVRIHADARSDLLNRSLQAQAFTTGNDLFFRHGAYAPGSPDGQQLVAHELTHVVQQDTGLASGFIQRLPASTQVKNALQEPKGDYSPVVRALEVYNKSINHRIFRETLENLMVSYEGVQNTAINYAIQKPRPIPRNVDYMSGLIKQVDVERIKAIEVVTTAERNPSKKRSTWRKGLMTSTSIIPAEMVYGGVIEQEAIVGKGSGGTNEVAKVKIGENTRFWKADKNDIPLVPLLESGRSRDEVNKLLEKTRWAGLELIAVQNEYWVPEAAGIIPKLDPNKEYEGYSEKQDLHLAKRDVAMSRLDELLNVGIIAKAELALRKIDKAYVMGSLMAGAAGKTAKEIGWAKLKNSGELQRLLSRLQLLDILAYQVDRNTGNFYIQTDAQGKVTGLTGIDNDMAFGQYKTDIKKPIRQYAYPGISAIVDEELATRILNLKVEDLKNAMQGLLIDTEIDALVVRCKKLQRHLLELQTNEQLVGKNQWGEETAAKLLKEGSNYYSVLNSKYGTRSTQPTQPTLPTLPQGVEPWLQQPPQLPPSLATQLQPQLPPPLPRPPAPQQLPPSLELAALLQELDEQLAALEGAPRGLPEPPATAIEPPARPPAGQRGYIGQRGPPLPDIDAMFRKLGPEFQNVTTTPTTAPEIEEVEAIMLLRCHDLLRQQIAAEVNQFGKGKMASARKIERVEQRLNALGRSYQKSPY